MPWTFNPFSGTFDEKGSGGGGGASYIDGEVATYADLPLDGTAALNSAWLVRTASGVWPVSRKQAGIYIRTATGGSNRDADYTYAGTMPDVFSDSQFLLYDNTDSSKNLAFDLGSISTGTTRIITVPDADITIDGAGDSRTPTTHGGSHDLGGADEVVRVRESTELRDADDPSATTALKCNSGNASGNIWNIFNTSEFRLSLGLGTAAEADIGTAAGEVSEGNHGHGNLTSDGKVGSTAGLMLVTTTAGAVTTLALGAANQVLRVNSGATALEFAAAASGGTKTYAFFTATDNQPPSTAFATLDTRNSIAVLDFDAATDESAVFVGIMPEASSLGSGLIVRLHWMATSATSGNVRWGVQLERSNTDLDADSFAAAVEANGAANGTSGILTTTAITVTDFDGITAGDVFRLKVFRNADDATNDTMTGDAELVAVEVRSAA